MVGFVQMVRKQFYEKNARIRADLRNVVNELRIL